LTFGCPNYYKKTRILVIWFKLSFTEAYSLACHLRTCSVPCAVHPWSGPNHS